MSTEWINHLPQDIRLFINQIKDLPDFPMHLAKLADILNQRAQKQAKIAQALAYQAWQLDPQNPILRYNTYWGVKKHIPGWHFRIVNDIERAEVYKQALQQSIQPGMTVLEIGAGSGILSMLAVRAGVRHIYTCEMEPKVAQVAQENIARNGLSDRITIITKKSTDLQIGSDLPEPADLLISEIVDNHLLGEDVLPIMEDAQARLLKPGSAILPTKIALRGALIGGAEWTKFCRVDTVDGFDLSALNQLSPPISQSSNLESSLDDLLSEPYTLFEFDFVKPVQYPAQVTTLDMPVRRAGILDGMLQWIRLDFGQGLVFENRPPNSHSSAWMPVLHVFPGRQPVFAGDTVHLHLEHNRKSIFVWPLS